MSSRASNKGSQRFSAFTFKTLLRHYARYAYAPRHGK